jgi:citrate synthase
MSTDPQKPESARLILGDKEIELPVLHGVENEVAIDIRQLRAETGAITYDPGLGNTGSAQSSITFLDGAEGILRYRGYPIEQLAEHSTFLEVAWLLMHGELPTRDELEEFRHEVTMHTMLHEDLRLFFSAIPKRGHPMAICAATVAALSTFYQDLKFDDPEGQRWAAALRLLAKFPTIAANSYKHSIGQPFVYPKNELSYTENILHMMFATPCEEYKADPVSAKALNLLFILHADHEQNCSTSTVRMVGSSQANLYASVSAGVNALWGPLHGGANQKVIEMLLEIEEGGMSPQDFMSRKAKDKNSQVRLMGFGHRVYKNYDPRAKILKKSCDEVLASHGQEVPAPRHRAGAREDRARGRLLHPAQALPQRRLLLGHHLPGAGHPDRHVHGVLRDGPPARLDLPVARAPRRPRLQDLPPAAGLPGRAGPRVRPDRQALRSLRALRNPPQSIRARDAKLASLALML